MAGATGVNAEFVLLSGTAAMVASALSMGSGAYLATKSEREWKAAVTYGLGLLLAPMIG